MSEDVDLKNWTSPTAHFRANLARWWPEFEAWYKSEEGGQKKRCADGRAKFARVVQRDDELFEWGIQFYTNWDVPDHDTILKNHKKMSAWKTGRVAAAKALEKVQKQSIGTQHHAPRHSSVEWELVTGPLGEDHMNRRYAKFPLGHVLVPQQPTNRGYG